MKILWLTTGSVSLVLGVAGIFLPVLPTVPFFLLTSYCYARGSEKFHQWFVSTSLYKNHIDNYVANKSMTLREKIMLVGTISAIIMVSMSFMHQIHLRILLSTIIAGHIIYFGFFVETRKEETE